MDKLYPDVSIDVVDEDRKHLKVGDVGEVAISGEFLSSGYWMNDELTGQRFKRTKRTTFSTFYTKDVGYMDDATLVVLGRARNASSIDCYRVARGLNEIGGVLDSAILVDDGSMDVFYAGDVSTEYVRTHLESVFPLHTFGHVKKLESLPMTDRGKIDRSALKTSA